MEVKGVESYQSNSKRILGKGRASLKSADGHGNDRQYNQVTQHTSGAQKLFVEWREASPGRKQYTIHI